jgi:uncharacterized coiled-coil protein SlyX
MALNKPYAAWHLLSRLSGMTGVVVGVIGLIIWLETADEVGSTLALIGLGLALLALLVELRGLTRLVRSRRGAMGSNVFLQVLLAAVVLAGLNAFSFFHYLRFDLTSERIFTIPQTLRAELSRLRGETDIVVLQRHTSFGQGEKPDNYDAAAERRIVDKVKDLVEQFRELGPRFRVEVLDVQEDGYQQKVRDLRAKSKELGEAVEMAPENSVFFYSGGKVQRLSFHDVYQLDRKASLEADGGRGNLVLVSQGVGPFANKVLNVQEKQPRVAVAVVHELFGLEADEDPRLTMSGAKKVLASRKFETRDIILKKWGEMGPPEPTALTYQENRLEQVEELLAELDQSIKKRREIVKELTEEIRYWKNSTLAELAKKYIYVYLANGQEGLIERESLSKLKGQKFKSVPPDEDDRKMQLGSREPLLVLHERGLKQDDQARSELLAERKTLNVENVEELRRFSDLRAKMNLLLADADLLIVPRFTLLSVPQRLVIPNRALRLEEEQLQAIKDFMKAGKPVLFCLGPANEPPDRRDPSDFLNPDRLEPMLEELGFRLPKQTVLFQAETKSFAERRSGLLIAGTHVEVPPVQFDWAAGVGPTGQLSRFPNAEPHPIRTSLGLTARSIGKDRPLELKLRHPRPVYFEPRETTPNVNPLLMMTSADAWNEDQPFPTPDRPVPRFEPPKEATPLKESYTQKRRGPFPIGAAAEVELPRSWYGEDKKDSRPAKVRVAVIGHGGAFAGPTLTPVQEKLLLDSCNWLLGRDDLLAQNLETWQYPRVELSAAAFNLWHLGAGRGLPLLFIYLGLVMFMVRRMR